VAYGHDYAGQIDGGWRKFEGVEAAAGIWSTAKDLGHLLRQLMKQTNNSSARPAMLKISDLLIKGQGDGYHYGVMVNKRSRGLILSHQGINPGYQAMIRIDLEASVASAAMINGEHCDSLLKILTQGPDG
jgi:CubicO group peptidase (beta-lactamase class C family)